MNNKASTTEAPSPRFRDEEIVQEYAAQLGIKFPSYDTYPTFTPAQKYIAVLAQNVRSSEAMVTDAAKHVAENAANALTRGHSNGIIQGSGPLLDAHVATLVERRENLKLAMQMLLAEPTAN